MFFDPITIVLPKDRIYSRLGYAKRITKLKSAQREEFERYIEEAQGFINLKGAGVRLPVSSLGGLEVELSIGVTFKSKSLAEFLIFFL